MPALIEYSSPNMYKHISSFRLGAIESKGGWDDSIDESGRAEVVVFFNLLEERGRGYVLFRGWYVIVHSDKHFIDIFSNKNLFHNYINVFLVQIH